MDYNNYELKDPLSKDITDILIDLMHDGDTEARSLLIEHNLYLVKLEVDKVSNDPSSDEYQTLFTNGTLALINAIDSYARERSESFTRYVRYMCMLAIRVGLTGKNKELNVVNSDKEIPTNSNIMSKLMFEGLDVYDDYEKKCVEQALKVALSKLNSVDYQILSKRYGLDGEQKSVSQLAKEHRCAESILRSHIKNSLTSLRNMLDETVRTDDDLTDISIEIVSKLSLKPDKLYRKEIKNLLKVQIGYLLKAIECLPENRQIIMNYYLGLNGESAIEMEKIGRILGTKKANIQRIISTSFDTLKRLINNMINIDNSYNNLNFNFIEILKPSNPDYHKNNFKLLTEEQVKLFKTMLNEFPDKSIDVLSLFLGIDWYTPQKYTEISRALGISTSEVFRTVGSTLNKMSLIYEQYKKYYNRNEDISGELVDSLLNDSKCYVKYVVKLLPRDRVRSLLMKVDSLSLEKMIVFKTYFGLDASKVKSLSETAERLYYSSTWVSTLLSETLLELKENMSQSKIM